MQLKPIWLSLLYTSTSLATSLDNAQAPLLPSYEAVHRPSQSSATSKELLDLHKKLIDIESISGNESPIALWLKTYLESKNWKVELQEVPPFIPYSLSDDGTQIWGRGSVDAKACVAAQIIAASNLVAPSTSFPSSPASSSKLLPPDSLSLLFVVGEEVGGDGMRYFSKHKPTNYTAVIFGEPTEGKLASGHKGLTSFEISVTGRAAHSGYPWLGVSANDILVEALGVLLEVGRSGLPSSKKYGPSTLNIGKVEGGVAANVVAANATAKVSIRIAEGEPEDIIRIVKEALQPVVKKATDKGAKFQFQVTQKGYGPVDMATDVPGFDSISVNYGTDVPNLPGNYTKYLYGPGSIFVAHSDHEHLAVKELEKAVKDYEKLILHAVKL